MSVFIIGEVGINHNGSLEIAKKLIDVAVSTGCDAVKFQKRTIEIVYRPGQLALPRESPWGTTTREQKEGLELSISEFGAIDAYCKDKGIEWFASCWDVPAQRLMRRYDWKHNKVASAMLTHMNFLEEVASERKPTFVSTGMATFDDIDRAVEIFGRADCPITLMHCVSTYPCAEEDCNIRMIETLRKRYGLPVGYSGHERGLIPSVLAAALNAVAIERHITLDRTMYGSDQAASLEPQGLGRLVRDVRNVEKILGDGEKRVLEEEVAIARKLRYFEDTDSPAAKP